MAGVLLQLTQGKAPGINCTALTCRGHPSSLPFLQQHFPGPSSSSVPVTPPPPLPRFPGPPAVSPPTSETLGSFWLLWGLVMGQGWGKRGFLGQQVAHPTAKGRTAGPGEGVVGWGGGTGWAETRSVALTGLECIAPLKTVQTGVQSVPASGTFISCQ